MNNNRVEEIKKEDKKAFRKFAVMIIISMIVGGIVGALSSNLKDILGESVPNFFGSIFKVITPYASIVLTILLIIVYKVIYSKSRKEYDLWKVRNEDDDKIDIIEENLSYIILFSSVNMILGFFFFGLGFMFLPTHDVDLDIMQLICLTVGFILCLATSTLIQNKIINFEKEINHLLKGSIYDTNFTQKWVDSCDEAIKLGIYKSAYKSYTAVNTTCIILWVVCIVGYNIWKIGIMPMVIVTIIWLVQSISYCMESIKQSKIK